MSTLYGTETSLATKIIFRLSSVVAETEYISIDDLKDKEFPTTKVGESVIWENKFLTRK